MSKISSYYYSNVFINCPFDAAYEGLFRAMIFAVHACRFTPRCAKEYNNSGDVRIEKIIRLMEESAYGIHDISLKDVRFNMPLELGIFIGCRRFGGKHHQLKNYLVLGDKPYDYQKYISDLSGQDIACHQATPEGIIKAILSLIHI